jgi:predicted peptidase
MSKKTIGLIAVVAAAVSILIVTGVMLLQNRSSGKRSSASHSAGSTRLTRGTRRDRGFTVDNVLKIDGAPDLHFSEYRPQDNGQPYALFITLPGYEGEHAQGIGENLRQENFAFEAQRYNDHMIVLAPQPDGWEEDSATQVTQLIQYVFRHDNIDRSRVYINGYSGGGETLSRVVEAHPQYFTAALMVSSQWDGSISNTASHRVPIYFFIGADDEYYSAAPFQTTYRELTRRYREQGLSQSEIDRLAVLDVKPRSYFTSRGMDNEHGGGGMAATDTEVMGWLFGAH